MQVVWLVSYTLAAWLGSGIMVWAGYGLTSRTLQILLHCLSIPVFFAPIFRLYFHRPDSLPPLAATLLAAGFIVALDVLVVGPVFMKGRLDFFESFWDWQAPALILVATIVLTGRLSR